MSSGNFSFIRMRVNESKPYSKWRIKQLGNGIRTVIGFTKGGGNEIQSVLFSKGQYSIEEAVQWMNEHGYIIQEVTLVSDVIPRIDDITFIEEAYVPTKGSKSNKYDWLFDKRTSEEIFFGEK